MALTGMRAYAVFGKLGKELAMNLDVLMDVDQAEVDEGGHPTSVGRINRPDGGCYEMRVTLLKEGTPAEATATATMSKGQKDAVAAAMAKRTRKPKGS